MTEPEEYILARPAIMPPGGIRPFQEIVFRGPYGQEHKETFYDITFDDIFVRLEDKKQQIREQIEPIISERLRWCDYCNDEVTDKHLSEIDDLTRTAIDKIVALVYGEKQ